MQKPISAIALVLALGSNALWACDQPASPTLPKGAEASMDEMVAGQSAVKSFQSALQIYRDCVSVDIESAKAALKEAGNAAEKERLAAEHASAVAAFNKAVEMEEAIAGQFNIEIRAFKAKN